MTTPSVLVTDGHLRPALAVVRSLGRAGYRVFTCAPVRHSLAGASRYAAGQALVPDPLSSASEFAAAVRQLVARWRIDVLLPISDESLLALGSVASTWAGVTVPFPPYSVLQRVADKADVTETAARLGIPVPRQSIISSRSDVREFAVSGLSFPVVLKPTRSVAGEAGHRTKLGVSYATSATDFESAVDRLPREAFPLLIQQRIDGPGAGVFLLVWDGRVIAHFAHERIREKPPSGGVSVCAESVAADPKALSDAQRLLAEYGWCGPAMVEFKQERTTGRYYLMEINGRFWGSLQLAIDAGVDFPALLMSAALGRHPNPVTKYSIGVRTHWWWGEVDHLIARLRGARAEGSGGRFDAMCRFLQSGRAARNEVLRADDPRPFIRESLDWFRGR